MAYNRQWSRKSSLGTVILAAGSVAALANDYALYYGGMDVVEVGALAVLAITGTHLLSDAFMLLSKTLNWLDIKTPRGHKGTAGWVKSLREIRHDLVRRGPALFWGSLKKGRGAIYSDFASNALCLGPAGSGKDTVNIGPNLLAVRGSKTILCLKRDTYQVYADALRKRGEIIYRISVGGVLNANDGEDESDCYNPLDNVADCFYRKGGIADVTSEIEEFSKRLYPEPPSGSGVSRFFDNGSCTYISFCNLNGTLIKGYDATLGDALQMLNDRASLLHHALWASGRLEQEDGSFAKIPLHESPWAENQSTEDIANFAEYLRALASKIVDQLTADDTRSVESFLTGATDQLSPLNITTRAHKVMQKSSFRFAEQKEKGKTVTVFIEADSSRLESQKLALEIIQFSMFNEWKRHPNKKKPVYLFANEITNLRLIGLESLLTWGRAYGIKIILYIQSLSAFRKTYGKEATSTLLSETEIKQFLPGQRDPETLDMIEKMLGQYSYISHNYKGGDRGPLGLEGYGTQEDAAPLMNADEIRRCKRTILLIRQNKPALVHTPSIAAIAPFRNQQGISPFFNKPYRLPVQLRLWRYYWPQGWSLKNLWSRS